VCVCVKKIYLTYSFVEIFFFFIIIRWGPFSDESDFFMAGKDQQPTTVGRGIIYSCLIRVMIYALCHMRDTCSKHATTVAADSMRFSSYIGHHLDLGLCHLHS
jgi:hypothetical protein